MKTVFIKGIGLIGSSLARAIKRVHADYEIIISDPDRKSVEFAIKNGIADRVAAGFAGAKKADFIILATPVSQIIADIELLATLELKKNVIVTDVGSTKVNIMKIAKKLTARGICFIGGHPMAGSHRTGAAAGNGDLFRDAYYFLVPTIEKERIFELETLLKGVHSKWFIIDGPHHDALVTQISDIPHVIAAALVNQAQASLANSPLGLEAAAGGFKSVTRIAASSPEMWSSIMIDNKKLIANQLESYINYLMKIEKMVSNGNKEGLYEFFSHAKDIRSKLE